ncbi:SEC-C motif-containing protein [Arthrobacter alpinus]|uniref:SEC-C motif-containing protein n=1 Tax=Arthrobacter alpinus TaxID=656366 RepID=A0A1H5G438_9MICC|nr:YchJ family metal-binding protein [Arthrobacter alpinus]SEE10460.1 SEC-C motif-containing protein [Arthrobacter alpinus]
MRCPCNSGEDFQGCCAKYLGGNSDGTVAYPPTAEALMRSRYTAFAVGDTSYLLRTWHPDTRPAELELDPDQQWYLLEILSTSRGGYFDDDGVVGFRASYRSAANRKLRDSLTETSSFIRQGKQWLYVDALEIH